MNIKKVISIVLSAIFIAIVPTACGEKTAGTVVESSTQAANVIVEDKSLTASSDNVKLIGRTYTQDGILWLAYSGEGFECEITGKKAEITVVGGNAAKTAANESNWARIAIYVDGERVADEQIDSEEKSIKVFDGEETRTATVKVVKLSECAMSTVGIKQITVDGAAKVSPTVEKEKFIEFIGDSITCGYGVDDEDRNHHFSTATEDVTRAYAYKTAEALEADYSIVSISGYGVLSGYSSNGAIQSAQVLPQYYDKVGFSYDTFAGTQVSSIEWSFERKPDVIVINLGTNDASYCKDDSKKADFEKAYVDFLKLVRAKNPDAQIICAYGTMGSDLFINIVNAIKTYTDETSDQKVTYLKFYQQSESDGYAADWHPTETTHTKSSELLVTKIKEVMGW